MVDAEAGDIKVGDEFSTDSGQTWWHAKRVEQHGDRVWIEAQNDFGSISSHTYHPFDDVVVRNELSEGLCRKSPN